MNVSSFGWRTIRPASLASDCGRGPTQAKSYDQDDLVVCVLRGDRRWSGWARGSVLDSDARPGRAREPGSAKH